MPHHNPYRRLVGRVIAILLIIPWPLLAPPLPARAEDTLPTSTIFIEEVAWAGSSLSTSDEWVELGIPGSTTSSIAGWSLTGAGGARIFLPDDAEIMPGGTYRIANYAESDEKSALAVTVNVATTTISLSNSALGIELWNASGTVVDRAGDGHAPPAGSSSLHATMIRAATSSEDLITSWITASSPAGFKDGVADFGAPGVCAICNTTSTAPEPTITPAIETVTPSQTSTTQQTIIVTPPPSPPPPPLHVSLNEAMSNPAAGPEWVELKIAETSATSTDRALELWDKSGRFMTIPAHTTIGTSGYLVLSLVSARLNNGGDDLSVREVPLNGSSGIVIDLIQIPTLEDGVAWAKRDDGTWTETEDLTPGALNRFSATIVSAPTAATTSPTIAATPTTSLTSTVSPTSTTYNGPPLTLRLNEAMSNPNGGKEWVELMIEPSGATITDRAYELWDASGKMMTIPAGTSITAPGYLLVTLPTSRLNNGGDSLSLREAGGDVTLDATDIPSLAKGISWARDETGEWTDCDTPTPGAINPAASQKDAETTANTDSTDEPSSEPSITHSTPSMSQSSSVNARVRLVGTVGSVPRLLGATHGFILLGEDGRAAIVYLPKHLNTPNFGSTVRVMGALTSTERQLELRMKTTDVWLTIATSTPPQPRTVDYLAPGMEDAWALVSATGTVKSSGATSAVIDVDSVDVNVSAPAAAGYRTKRLVPGDVIHVTGLLDPRKEAPTILIRVPEDVTLVSHAPESVTPPTSASSAPHGGSGLPDWIPFGAAGGAVVATGGFQRIRAILKRRKLETLAAAR